MCDMPCLLILRLVLVLLSPLFGGKEWQRPRLQTHFTTTKVHVMPETARLRVMVGISLSTNRYIHVYLYLSCIFLLDQVKMHM